MVTLRVMVEVNEEEVEDDGGRGSKEREIGRASCRERV